MIKVIDGVFEEMSNAEYHSSLGFSKSTLDGILKQADYIEWKSRVEKFEDRNLLVGSALHTFVLEPTEYDKRYAVRPKFDMRKKEDKEQAILWDNNHCDYDILSNDEHESILNMGFSIKASPNAQSLLAEGNAEISIYQTIDDIQFKIRPDYINVEKGYIVDVKTTRDINNFGKSAVDYGYDLQAYMYSMIAERVYGKPFKFFFVVVGKERSCGCYPVRVLETPSVVMERGQRLFNQAVAKVKALSNATAPIYDTLTLPSWVLNNNAF